MLSPEPVASLTPQRWEELGQKLARDGYFVLPKLVPAQGLARLRDELLDEFARVKREGELFSGGGTISGHLNCFPGAGARFVYDALNDAGVVDLIRHFSPQATRMPNIGCNMNLIGSRAQNSHVDGYADSAFMIANIAVVDTDLVNGAIELNPGSHVRDYKFHQFVLAGHAPKRITMSVGDVLIRPSTLWHRGMPNFSKTIRPMLGFTWEDGGSKLEDSFSAHGGKIAFLPNRYTQDFVGQLRERAFANLPALGNGYLFVRSLLSG
ncbi:MAG: phytanoyl-CoA dioxygenase family protein [Myxococcales bacterium]